MSDLAEYERRISAALEAIGAGVEALAKPAPDQGSAEAELVDLRAKLEEEKVANAQLEQRIRKLKRHKDRDAAGQAEALESQNAKIASIDKELQHLRQVNGQLRDTVAKLRDANSEGVADPHLINKTMLTELEALRAVQAADAAEVDAILEELAPLMKEDV